MKVHQIISSAFQVRKQKSNEQNTLNLASFGVSAPVTKSELTSEKSALAIKNNSIASMSFKGREVRNEIRVGTSGLYSSYVNVSSHPDESVERTPKGVWTRPANTYSGDRIATIEVYYADEGEYITDEMREKYHYIVRKEEPFLNLQHIKGNYKNGYKNFANEAVREVVYLENLQKHAKESLKLNSYYLSENQKKYDFALEEKNRVQTAKETHLWEPHKYDKELEKAEYFLDQNRQKLEDSKLKNNLYKQQIAHAQEKLPSAGQKYLLLKELDDTAGSREPLGKKRWEVKYDKDMLEIDIEHIDKDIEDIKASKEVNKIRMHLAEENIKKLQTEFEANKVKEAVESYKADIRENQRALEEKNQNISDLVKQREKKLAEFKDKSAYLDSLCKEYDRLDAKLEKLMSDIEKFYKEKYPEYLW